MSFTERNGSLCIIQQVVGVMVVAVNVTVYGYIQPYKSLLANLLEIAVNINFLFLLLINSTSFFHEDMFTFSDISSNITSSDCGSSIAGIAHVSWLLMPVYYLPILGLSITAAMFAIHFIRYIIMCVISIRYTTSTRGLSQIHEAMLDNPEGVARGII